MKIARYEDFTEICDKVLDDIEANGTEFVITRDDKPYVRMIPVDGTGGQSEAKTAAA